MQQNAQKQKKFRIIRKFEENLQKILEKLPWLNKTWKKILEKTVSSKKKI